MAWTADSINVTADSLIFTADGFAYTGYSVSASTPFWSADGNFNWSADGYPGWSADGYEPTTLAIATTLLATSAINVGPLTYVYDQYVPVGWVVTGYPPFLNNPPASGYLPLLISNGPAPAATLVTVPNVVGMYYFNAQLALLQAGTLIAFPTFVIASTVVPGNVTAQSISPGTMVPSQTPVTLTVSGFTVINQPNVVVPVP